MFFVILLHYKSNTSQGHVFLVGKKPWQLLFMEHDVLLLLYGADSILHKSFLKPALKPKNFGK